MRRSLVVGGAVFVAIQFVPYGWQHPNPPVTQDAPWPSPAAREIAVRACYDCHSNETRWPLYSYVAPMSWLVRRDVEVGRDELNFSAWDEDGDEAEDAAEAALDGSMPPTRYRLVHPDARLSDEMVAVLADALSQMEGDEDDGDSSGPGGGG